MRLYGRRFLKNSMVNAVGAQVESRDGIVIDIDRENKFCRVKIQGSEEYIVAHFPENTNSTPDWLKPANAVRICHRGGVRGKVEVVGPGQTIPTGINVKPPQENLPQDCILTGCELILPVCNREAFGSGKGIVWVAAGNYRVKGLVKPTSPLRCRAAYPLLMKSGAKIGLLAEQFVFVLPSSGMWSYQRIVLDKASGKISALSGGSSATPILPEVPDGKLDCGWVLLQGGKGAIEETDINVFWQKPEPCYFIVECDGYLSAGQDYAAIKVTVKDQFGRDCTQADQRWSMQAKITSGLGELLEAEAASGSGSKVITVYSQRGQASGVFFYSRGTAVITGQKDSPSICVSVDSVPFPAFDVDIALFDHYGEPI